LSGKKLQETRTLERKVKMATWKLSEEQLDKIGKYTKTVNEHNRRVKFFPQITDGVLLGVDVRFGAPKSLRMTDSKELKERIYREIEERSRNRLIPDRGSAFERGVLELKYTSIYRRSDEQVVIEPLKFIADDMIDIIIGKKKLD